MILNSYEQKMALDYIVYMMIGSHFKRTDFPAKHLEKGMHLYYMLLGSGLQIELEEKAECFFLEKVEKHLPATSVLLLFYKP